MCLTVKAGCVRRMEGGKEGFHICWTLILEEAAVITCHILETVWVVWLHSEQRPYLAFMSVNALCIGLFNCSNHFYWRKCDVILVMQVVVRLRYPRCCMIATAMQICGCVTAHGWSGGNWSLRCYRTLLVQWDLVCPCESECRLGTLKGRKAERRTDSQTERQTYS